jgi:hypothetical protein
VEDLEDDDLSRRIYDVNWDDHQYIAILNRESTMDYML